MAFTYFFRDTYSIELAVENLTKDGKNRFKIWDAGSAYGQEPYSFAIILAEKIGIYKFSDIKIFATDIDQNNIFGDIIKNGVYGINDLKRIPQNLFKKYFHPTKDIDRYSVDSRIKKSITFIKHDLLTLNSVGTNFDIVICKNVLLHFQYDQRIEVIQMFYNSLKKGGYLLMEHTQKLPKELLTYFKKIGNAELYQKL